MKTGLCMSLAVDRLEMKGLWSKGIRYFISM